MTDMTDLKQLIYFSHYEIHILLLSVAAPNIVVTMYATYHFGTILELNSYLQNMVITFIFIILSNAPTITHGDVKLQLNYFNLLMYFLQVIIIIILLFFKYVYRFGTVLIEEIKY